MRFKSQPDSPYQVFAVTGVNTISFGIQASEDAKRDLLGFAVERIDPAENERYFMPGFKVFPSVIPFPTPEVFVSTWEHPIQSFVWDEFTAKENHEYEYLFYPIKGKPRNLDRSTEPARIRVRTEPLFSGGPHDVFFNRGVASSQAYQRRFGKLKPSEVPCSEEALDWLSRDLVKAIKRFINNAREGDQLLGCFYEFRYLPVVQELQDAIEHRHVDVQLIIDAKVNEYTDKKGQFHESFPREDNLKMLKDRIPMERVTLRQARSNAIQHNKFMVLVRGGSPIEVWTGSTNLSLGGFCGQTNVGHWVRDPEVARQFTRYWEVLKRDPGAVEGLDSGEAKKANRELRDTIAGLHMTPTCIDEIPPGTTAVFSPRAGSQVLDMYVELLDRAEACSCITLAFGVNESFKQALHDNTISSPVTFMLLEKRDSQNPKSKKPFFELTYSNNVYQAWGSYIKDSVHQWTKETNASLLNLNKHVTYIHSKFLLHDALSDDPIVVTGSANFSEPSTNENDENMLIIRGNQRVADIYFTEFNRLFNHYYYRSVMETIKEKNEAPQDGKKVKDSNVSIFLQEKAEKWLPKYAPGTLRSKRLRLFTQMVSAETLECTTSKS